MLAELAADVRARRRSAQELVRNSLDRIEAARGPGGAGGGRAAGLGASARAAAGVGPIRTPAALCGLAGIKPTNGVVGREPIPDWIDLSTDGPLATTVADLALLLELEA